MIPTRRRLADTSRSERWGGLVAVAVFAVEPGDRVLVLPTESLADGFTVTATLPNEPAPS